MRRPGRAMTRPYGVNTMEQFYIKVTTEALMLILILSAPPLLISMLVGLMISLFQATTQIQEQTLTFVPKITAVFLTIAITGYWMMGQMIKFTISLFMNFPQFVN
jgi:flagellar biosynthetic protein FliQ